MNDSFSDNELDSILNNSIEKIKEFYNSMNIFACQIEETVSKLHSSMVNVEKLKEKEGVYNPTKRLSNTSIYDLCKYGYKTGLLFYKIISEMEDRNPLEVNGYNPIGFDVGFTREKYPNVTAIGANELLEKYGLKYPNHYYYGECNELIYVSQETTSNKHSLLQSKIEDMFNAGIITKLEKVILLLTIDYRNAIVQYDFEIESRKDAIKQTLTK